jgi:hypothetical protein
MEFVSEESQVVLVDFGSKVEIRSLPCDFEKPGDLLNVLNVVQLIKLPVSRNAYVYPGQCSSLCRRDGGFRNHPEEL